MSGSPNDADLRRALRTLECGDIEEAEVTLSTNLPGRKQTMRLRRRPGRHFVVETTIITEAGDDIRSEILDWNDRHPFVAFRLRDDALIAREQIAVDIAEEERIRIIHFLARLADRLEYELAKGRDIH